MRPVGKNPEARRPAHQKELPSWIRVKKIVWGEKRHPRQEFFLPGIFLCVLSLEGGLVLILGGVKSGKSTYALALARKHSEPRAFLATAEPFDPEMKKRIERHQESRGDGFELFEEPLDISGILPKLNHNVIVVDCLTVWLANLYHHNQDITKEEERLLDNLNGREIFVSNEIGWGVIPESTLARDYAERLAKLNQKLARRAKAVYLMVAGIAVKIK